MPIYLQYGDIKGDVKDAGHVDWIDLASAQLGTFRHDRGRPTGHTITEIVVTKEVDRASSELQREAIMGNAKAAKIDFADASGHVYLTIELTNTLISSFSVSGRGDRPMEALTLNFTAIKYVSG